ncbi:MAG: hypothetical protein EOP56_01045 [Sphingobacteriales bacterium]|nr:MAG: hypothetical protein EOP56_01045 [Sphingobacteriales bacterium]
MTNVYKWLWPGAGIITDSCTVRMTRVDDRISELARKRNLIQDKFRRFVSSQCKSYICENLRMGLDSVALVLFIENEFGFRMLDSEAEATHTVGDMQALVWRYIGNRGIMTEEEMKLKLRDIISSQLAIALEDISAEKSFVRDFGIS